MNGCQTRVYKFEKHPDDFSRFRCGVSLHSHTMHSKEYLGRLPTYGAAGDGTGARTVPSNPGCVGGNGIPLSYEEPELRHRLSWSLNS